MKKQLLSIIISLPSFYLCAQNVPNPGFELWTTQGQTESPDGWIGSPAITKSIDANSGSFSARIEAGTFTNPQSGQTFQIPGRLVTGITGGGMGAQGIEGYPSTLRPDSITGMFKYVPNGFDSCIIRIKITSWNSTTASRDILGQGVFVSYGSAGYSTFSSPIEYVSSNTPDSCTIELMSSNPQSGIQGSVLWIDDIELISTLGLMDESDNKVQVYPVPTNDVLCLQGIDNNKELRILDSFGRSMGCKTVSDNRIDMSEFEPGIYYIVFGTANNSILRKVVKL